MGSGDHNLLVRSSFANTYLLMPDPADSASWWLVDWKKVKTRPDTMVDYS